SSYAAIANWISVFPLFFTLRLHRLPRSTLFPYTTLFRSGSNRNGIAFNRVFQVIDALPEGALDRKLREAVKASFDAIIERALSGDRKSTRLNSSHVKISYAVFCLKKKSTNAT